MTLVGQVDLMILQERSVDHSGNREVFDSYISKDIAEMKASELNRKEKQ